MNISNVCLRNPIITYNYNTQKIKSADNPATRDVQYNYDSNIFASNAKISFKSSDETELFKNLKRIARNLHNLGKSSQEEFNKMAERIYGNSLDETRLKSYYSIYGKFLLTINKEPFSYSSNLNDINDLLGARGIAHTKEDIDDFIRNIQKEIEAGNLIITEINNYHSNDVIPYFTSEHIESILESCKKAGLDKPIIKNGPARRNIEHDNGYCAGHIAGIMKTGVHVEFQIKGSEVSKIDKLTMLTRSILSEKPLSETLDLSDPDLYDRINEIRTGIERLELDDAELSCFLKYQHDLYKYARALELHQDNVQEPQFPEDVLYNALSKEFLEETMNLIQ